MPELPEVETTRRGIAPHLIGHTVRRVEVRERRLRWPVPEELEVALPGQTISAVERRAKYLVVRTALGNALLHLGMSGSLRILPAGAAVQKHDHVDVVFDGHCLRFTDPRRFGALLWTRGPVEQHPLLAHLGPEPLSQRDFNAAYLYALSRARQIAVKPFIMDGRVVVGVGNIYASEALFLAGIRPTRAAGRIGLLRYERLVEAIRQVLGEAIAQGGTTLRDFVGGSGEPGYFRQSLNVYDRAGQPCRRCGSAIRSLRLGQRSTYFCARCQR